MSKFKNPYVRKREIERKLEILEVDEKHFNNYPPTKRQCKRQREEEEVKNKIFFLVIEKITIDSCIKYFEKELRKKGLMVQIKINSLEEEIKKLRKFETERVKELKKTTKGVKTNGNI